jgi:TonB family protein
MFRFNRFYLLGSLLFSFIIPAIPVNVSLLSASIVTYISSENLQAADVPKQLISSQNVTSISIWTILTGLYIFITTILLLRFIVNLVRLEIMRSVRPSIPGDGYKIVLIDEQVLPYSFHSAIFINSEEYNEGRIPAELLTHEISHVSQKHSADVIICELIKVFFWFNPMVFLYKSAIMLNHEYLADEAVTKQQNNSLSYINILLNIAFRNKNSYLASSFNYSFTKKRLLMMTINKFSKTVIFKKIAVIPLFLSLGFFVINAQEPGSTKSSAHIPIPPPPPPPPSIPLPPPPPPPDFLHFDTPTGKPGLVILDGVESDVDVSKVDLNKMEGVVVFKDEEAITKYGDKGKNGVVEFTTRKKDSEIPKDKVIYAEVRKTPPDKVNADAPYVEVEENPEFPGGEAAMSAWISKNLIYPPEAKNQKVEGSVRVKFLVDKMGKIGSVSILRSDNTLLNDEATRIISKMPDWKPGKQGGKIVPVYRMVLVNFKL